MNCDETHPLIHAYADGELDLVRSVEIERHLKSCSRCATETRSIQSLQSVLRQSDLAYSAPPAFRQRLGRAVIESRLPAPPRVPWLWQWLAMTAAAFAVIALLLRPAGISERDRMIDSVIDSHVRSLMAGHLTDVESTDQHTVKPWFNGKTDFAPEVKDFAAQGFPLAGGRLDYLDGQTVAALVYRHNKHVINVFISPASRTAPTGTENRRGYSVVARNMKGLHYCLVSDLNAQELNEFADRLGE